MYLKGNINHKKYSLAFQMNLFNLQSRGHSPESSFIFFWVEIFSQKKLNNLFFIIHPPRKKKKLCHLLPALTLTPAPFLSKKPKGIHSENCFHILWCHFGKYSSLSPHQWILWFTKILFSLILFFFTHCFSLHNVPLLFLTDIECTY